MPAGIEVKFGPFGDVVGEAKDLASGIGGHNQDHGIQGGMAEFKIGEVMAGINVVSVFCHLR